MPPDDFEFRQSVIILDILESDWNKWFTGIITING